MRGKIHEEGWGNRQVEAGQIRRESWGTVKKGKCHWWKPERKITEKQKRPEGTVHTRRKTISVPEGAEWRVKSES